MSEELRLPWYAEELDDGATIVNADGEMVDLQTLLRLAAAVPVIVAECDKIECCLEGVTATTAREIDAALAKIRRALAGGTDE